MKYEELSEGDGGGGKHDKPPGGEGVLRDVPPGRCGCGSSESVELVQWGTGIGLMCALCRSEIIKPGPGPTA